MERDFETADRLRDELRHDLGVLVFDDERTWRARDAPGSYGGYRGGGGGGGGPQWEYNRDPEDGPEASEVDVEKVNAMLAERGMAKRARDFDAADRIRDELRRELGVQVDDNMRMWTTSTARRYGRMGGGGGGGGGDRDRRELPPAATGNGKVDNRPAWMVQKEREEARPAPLATRSLRPHS